MVPDDAEAQDVVQEIWLRAFGKLHTFRGESALGTWLARVAINIAISSQRRKGRLVPLQDDDATEQAMQSPDLPAISGPMQALSGANCGPCCRPRSKACR